MNRDEILHWKNRYDEEEDIYNEGDEEGLREKLFLKCMKREVQTGIGSISEASWGVLVRVPTLNKENSIVDEHIGLRDRFLRVFAA